MTYYTISPSAMLKDLVRCFWVLESDAPSYTHRAMADVCAEMVFHYKGQFDELTASKAEPSCLSSVQGPSTKIRRFKIEQAFGIFGVYLYPHAIPFFFNMPATALRNQMPDLITLLGREGSVLEEEMMLAPGNHQRMSIITTFLENRLKKNEHTQHVLVGAIRFILQSKGQIRIEELANQYFISTRQFERKFLEFSGLSPKLFSRIVRFHAACDHFGASCKSLSDIAYDCGYYDQSHFIHEFKEFSGHHPKRYFSGQAEGVEWKST